MIAPRPTVPTIPARAKAPRLGVTVVAELVDAIVRGDLPPGSTLPPESVLCEQFAVSRTVIRESVKRMEEKGLVTVAQGRGTQVAPASAWKMADETVFVGPRRQRCDARHAGRPERRARCARGGDRPGCRDRAGAGGCRAAAQAPCSSCAIRSPTRRRSARPTSSSTPSSARCRGTGWRTRSSGRCSCRPGQRALLSSTAVRDHARRARGGVFEAIDAGDPDAAEQAMKRHILDAWERRARRGPRH